MNDAPASSSDAPRRRPCSIATPAGWVVRAAVVAGLLGVMHLLGWREHTNVLSGTMGLSSRADYLPAIAGGLYLLGWFAAVIFVPIALIGAGVFALLLRCTKQACGAADCITRS